MGLPISFRWSGCIINQKGWVRLEVDVLSTSFQSNNVSFHVGCHVLENYIENYRTAPNYPYESVERLKFIPSPPKRDQS